MCFFVIVLFSSCNKSELNNGRVSDSSEKAISKSPERKYQERFAVTEDNLKDFLFRHYSDRIVKDIRYNMWEGHVYSYEVEFDKGWAIIAGDRRVSPVLAESEDGKLDFKDIEPWTDVMSDAYDALTQLIFSEEPNQLSGYLIM